MFHLEISRTWNEDGYGTQIMGKWRVFVCLLSGKQNNGTEKKSKGITNILRLIDRQLKWQKHTEKTIMDK